jgi:hypothetical protein
MEHENVRGIENQQGIVITRVDEVVKEVFQQFHIYFTKGDEDNTGLTPKNE